MRFGNDKLGIHNEKDFFFLLFLFSYWIWVRGEDRGGVFVLDLVNCFGVQKHVGLRVWRIGCTNKECDWYKILFTRDLEMIGLEIHDERKLVVGSPIYMFIKNPELPQLTLRGHLVRGIIISGWNVGLFYRAFC